MPELRERNLRRQRHQSERIDIAVQLGPRAGDGCDKGNPDDVKGFRSLQ
ncbi:hypothetical protein [Saccharothrix saharensis]|nr:hypothetical protein [Saccharothrix saharensis]